MKLFSAFCVSSFAFIANPAVVRLVTAGSETSEQLLSKSLENCAAPGGASTDSCDEIAVGSEANLGHEGLSLLSLRTVQGKGKGTRLRTQSPNTERKHRRQKPRGKAWLALAETRAIRADVEHASIALEAANSTKSTTSKKHSAHEWITKERMAMRRQSETEQAFDSFIKSMETSQDQCSAKLLELGKQIHPASAHVKSLSEQLVAHLSVVTTSKSDLATSDNAEHDAMTVFNVEIGKCDKERAEAATKVQQFKTELEDLEKIANPRERHGRKERPGKPEEVANATEPGENGGNEEVTLLQLKKRPPSEKGKKLLSLKSFSKQQCLAFLRYNKGKKTLKQEPNENAAAEAETAGDAECEHQVLALQTKFEASYQKLYELIEENEASMHDYQCDTEAEAVRDGALLPLVSLRQKASDKIEESSAAVAALNPVIERFNFQIEKMEHMMDKVKVECSETTAISQHLASVRNLILNTMECPDAKDLTLEMPQEHCKTNGHGCTWTCSDKGMVFSTGGNYGSLSSVKCDENCEADTCVPLNRWEGGRAFCERKCIENPFCVAFMHDVGWETCELYFDVLNGDFRKSPENVKVGLKERWVCFIHERVASVNQHRDPSHPLTDHHFVEEWWWYYENVDKDWWYYYSQTDFDGDGYYYYTPITGAVADEIPCPLGDPTDYGGPPEDKLNDAMWHPTNAQLMILTGANGTNVAESGKYMGADTALEAYSGNRVAAEVQAEADAAEVAETPAAGNAEEGGNEGV